MADPVAGQACLLQAILPTAGSVYWHALVFAVDTLEGVFAVDDAPPNADLPAPMAAFAIADFWDDPAAAPPPASGLPGDPPFALNVVPGSTPLGGYVEGDDAAGAEFRMLLGMAPLDDDDSDQGPHEVARRAMRAWLGRLGLSVAFHGLNAEVPRAGARPELPKASIFFSSVEWRAHSPRELREKAPVGVFATGALAESAFATPPDSRGNIAYNADGRPLLLCGQFEARFVLRFEFGRRSEARAVRREFPLRLAFGAHRGDDQGLQGAQTVGSVYLPVIFEDVQVEGEEIALIFEGSDTLTLPENTRTRDRWILQYAGIAAYPWVELGVSATNNDLGVRVLKDGNTVALDDLELDKIV